MSCVISPPSWEPAFASVTCRHTPSHNDFGTAALLAAMHDAGVGSLVLASSMVVYGEGRYACVRHGEQVPPPRSREALDAGDFENHCPRCDEPLAWRLVEESARMDPRSSYAASKLAQEHYAATWARQAESAVVALRYHNVYGPGMPRDTPYSGVAAMFRSSIERGEPPRVFEDGGQMRDFVHVADVARANVAAISAVARSSAGQRWRRTTSAPGSRSRSVTWPTWSSGHPEQPGDRRSPASTVRATCDTSSRRHGWRARSSASPHRCPPSEGLSAFATAPLRS